jgi:short-subunit dehydrogenase
MSALQAPRRRKRSAIAPVGGAALVTGASSGIGEAFARILAARGAEVLLTALPQDEDRLQQIAEELAQVHGVRCETVPIDLGQRDGPDALQAAADELDFEPDLLVNSAGVGGTGRFGEAPLEQELQMVHVNVEALVRLTAIYVPRMAARGAGAVVNIASTAAFQPLPYFSVYAASKAFVLSFGEALWAEHLCTGVRIVTVCSGPVETPFHGNGNAARADGPVKRYLRRRYMTTERVVTSALDALEHDRPLVVLRMPAIGLLYRPVALVRSVLPLRVRLRISERLNRWYFDEQRR